MSTYALVTALNKYTNIQIYKYTNINHLIYSSWVIYITMPVALSEPLPKFFLAKV